MDSFKSIFPTPSPCVTRKWAKVIKMYRSQLRWLDDIRKRIVASTGIKHKTMEEFRRCLHPEIAQSY